MTPFSVLVSVYAKEKPNWLAEALDSILVKQSVLPSEVVLVVDGPITDELEAVILKYKSQYSETFVVHHLSSNYGLGYALNEGLKICKYDLIARMDADDIAQPNRFKVQLAFMQDNPIVDILGSSAEDINENGESIAVRSVPSEHDDIYKLMWTCPLIHPSVIFKKNVVLNAGSYTKNLKRRQDYELWFRCAQQGAHFANICEPLIRYRITDNTYARNSLKVAWQQAMIGYKGCRALSLGLKAHIGVFYPVFKALLPLKARKVLEGLIKNFDPRGKH